MNKKLLRLGVQRQHLTLTHLQLLVRVA